ncbi:MAG: flagellar FliJ family protein [Candidatus Zixiibacteriota bacterium]
MKEKKPLKKFNYRFEKVLSFKKHLEKQKQRELAEAIAFEQKQKQEILAVLDDRSNHQLQEKKFLTGKIDGNLLTRYSRYYMKLKQMEINGRELLANIKEEVGKRHEKLVGATKQRKIYEKLKERHLDRHTNELKLLLQKENDEIGQTMFFRNK